MHGGSEVSMPYVKYLGGRPPDSIREHVSYEDRSAPCYEGLAKLSADARRFAEGTYSDTTERVNAVRDHVDNRPYPGLAHVGGVGFVDDNAVRAIDKVITGE